MSEPDSSTAERTSSPPPAPVRDHSDTPFIVGLAVIAATYVLLLVGLIAADVAYISKPSTSGDAEAITAMDRVNAALSDPDIRYSIKLTLLSCFFTAILSLLFAVPIGYLLSRFRFPGRSLVDAILDIPIVLPPLVVGLSLLILFQFPPFSLLSRSVVYLSLIHI